MCEIRKLPDGELAVMQAVWELEGPATRPELEAALASSHPMAATTLLTLLSRLVEKGFLSQEKAGRGSRWTPLVNREDYLAAQGSRFYRSLCGGDLSRFANALCHSGLTREELSQLRKLLEEVEG